MAPFEALAGRRGARVRRSPDATVASALTVVLGGCAQAASVAWPLASNSDLLAFLGMHEGQPVWWLQLLALTLLAWRLARSRDWIAAGFLGWLFATAWLAGTVGWTFVAMHTYGGLPFVLAALAVLLWTALLGVFYAAACVLFVAIRPVNRAWAAIVFAALWLMAELARGTWLTGFGWGAIGYAHVDGPLSILARWVGVYGLSALSAWLAMTLAQLAPGGSGGPLKGRLAVFSLALLVLIAPSLVSQFMPGASDPAHSGARLSVSLLQGNIAQNEKFEAGSGVPQALDWYAEQLRASGTSLVIAPETAIAVLPQQLPPGYWETLQQRFAAGEQAALIGIPLGNLEQGYTNSVLGLQPGQKQPWRYDKRHLVPFGEFIPPLFKWFTALMNIPLGDFNRGAMSQPPFVWQGQRLALTICYEDLFGEELAPSLADPALAPTIFVNISNLAWFGTGLAKEQHLQIARMRALEFERAFVLATNTGLTAIIDHRGQVSKRLPSDTRAVLVGTVEGRTGLTPYAAWVAKFGLGPLWLLALACLMLAIRASRTTQRDDRP